MKRVNNQYISILLGIIIIFISLVPLSLGEEQDPRQAIGDIVGVNGSAIPLSEEEFDEVKNEYLKKEWSKVIENTPFIGAIHKYLLAHPLLTKIPFGTAYEFTPTFLLVIIFWIYFLFGFYRINDYNVFSKTTSFFIALGMTVILAQVKLYYGLSKYLTDILINQSNWWIRGIIIIVTIVILMIVYQTNKILSIKVRNQRKNFNREADEKKLAAGAKAGERLSKAISGED